MPAYDPEIQENNCALTDVPATDDGLLKLPVYPLIHFIRSDVEANIDTSLTWSQLTTPEINFTVVRPLVLKYAKAHNPAVVYAMLVVRSHFQSLAENNLAFAGIIQTRASLCELLAVKLLRHFTSSQVELATVLTHAWCPLQSAPDRVVEEVKIIVGDNTAYLDEASSALEVAISTESKHFCSSPLVQNIITDIWMGRVIFSTSSPHALVQDNYKSRAVSIYDPRDAPFLDHYRLRVPRYQAIIEVVNFAILLFLFILCLSSKNLSHITASEVVFMVFVFGFILDEFAASQEHGWTIYFASMWNGFDMVFIFIFLSYLGLRIKGITRHDEWYSDLAFDILSCGACILFPRMAFFSISNNVVILALKGMIADFLYFIAIAAICFSGLLFTLHSLADDKWPVKDIAWLMVRIWFGNTSLSFGQAKSFHPIFGPILMVIFAALSNTLLITILISILSNTFARINEHASQEFLFQFAISTLEGVKADAVSVYQPPFNLAAYAILSVLSWFFSPRALHTANVFMIRVTSFPMLVAIACYERFVLPGPGLVESSKGVASALYNIVPRQVKDLPFFDAIVGSRSHNLLDAVLHADYEIGDLGPFEGEDGDALLSVNEPSQKIQTNRNDEDPENDLRGRRVKSSISHHPVTPTTGRSRSQRPEDARQAGLLPLGPESPLARSFAHRRLLSVDRDAPHPPPGEDVIAGLKRIEAMLTERSTLEKELKDVSERQTRIEALLLSLTREMRA